MSGSLSAEIYRREGEDFRSVRLTVGEDGAVRLDAQDFGKTVQEFWGEDEYEFSVATPAEAFHKLMLALLHEHRGGRDRTRGDNASSIIGPSNVTPQHMFALLVERYTGRSGAIDEFREFCQKEGIAHDFWNWF
jgi:hypothetical protein